MFTSDQLQILEQARGKFGFIIQLEKAIEEFQELIHELKLRKIDFLQTDIKPYPRREMLIDEIADAIVVTEHLKAYFNDTAIQERVNFKVNRLKERMENEN